MSKSVILALASAASALASAAAAVAEEYGGEGGGEATDTPAKRTRGPNKPKDEAPAGKTFPELQELIKPLVEAGQGAEVKKLIAKHANGGTLKELVGLPENHAAFQKDLDALSY